MKLLSLLFVAFLFAGFSPFPQQQEKKNVEICINLDSAIASCPQWVYIHRYNHNERIIDDSVYIEKGQRQIRLRAYAPKERWFSILFAEKGPIDWYVILAPGTHAVASISEKDGTVPMVEVQGSYATNERVRNNKVSIGFNEQKRDLNAQLAFPNLPIDEQKRINAEIERINQQLDSLHLDIVLHSPSLMNVTSTLRSKLKNKVSRDSLVSLCRIALQRFPGDTDIEDMITQVKRRYPPESEESKRVDQRLRYLINRRTTNWIATKRATQSVPTVKPEITAVRLPSDKGDTISIAQLKGKLILVDFWASWCIPCREGMPYIRKAVERYGDRLTVCLISMDKQHDAWKKLIVTDRLEQFINLTAVDNAGNMDKTVDGLGIKSIPYSFLLDEKHQVIATGLHKEALMNKLDSLLAP